MFPIPISPSLLSASSSETLAELVIERHLVRLEESSEPTAKKGSRYDHVGTTARLPRGLRIGSGNVGPIC